tara:strand:- start:153 stop:371 length:219 start_codon:yes stop_codon:yes gene_type:complete
MSKLTKSFTIDTANSDEEYLYVDVFGGLSVSIKRTHEGVIVDIYPGTPPDEDGECVLDSACAEWPLNDRGES